MARIRFLARLQFVCLFFRFTDFAIFRFPSTAAREPRYPCHYPSEIVLFDAGTTEYWVASGCWGRWSVVSWRATKLQNRNALSSAALRMLCSQCTKKGGRRESEREQSAHALPLQRMKILKRGPSADACVSGSSVTDLVTVFLFLCL